MGGLIFVQDRFFAPSLQNPLDQCGPEVSGARLEKLPGDPFFAAL